MTTSATPARLAKLRAPAMKKSAEETSKPMAKTNSTATALRAFLSKMLSRKSKPRNKDAVSTNAL